MKMKRPTRRQYLFAFTCCLLIVLVVVGWRVVSLLDAEPTIKIDYLAEYNRITRPAEYDPDKNAAPHYEKLFSEFTPLPMELNGKNNSWPAEQSPVELDALEEWAGVNKSAAEILHIAAQHPYCWMEAKSSDDSLTNLELQHSKEQRECAWGIILLAKYKASKGDIDGALQLLADLYTMGIHRSKGDTLLEQLVGLAVCQLSSEAIIVVLNRCDVHKNILSRMGEAFVPRIRQLEVPRFTRGEFLVALDCIQRAFTDDGSQDGRLIPKELCRIRKEGLYAVSLSYPQAVWICLNHPTRRDTVDRYQDFFKFAAELAFKTPWDMYVKSTGYEQQLTSFLDCNYFLNYGVRAFAGVIHFCWQGITQDRALVTVLGILAYKAEKGLLPRSLGDLVREGYLTNVPLNPFSDGPLVYKVDGDDFTLYSVGADFSDNDGAACSWVRTKDDGDRVFWPTASEPGEI